MSTKHELQNIISGNGTARNGEVIRSITNFLRREKKTAFSLKSKKLSKDQETKVLSEFITKTNLWYSNVDFAKYIGEGGEQKVYEYSDPSFVLKLNDSIYYSSWEDYLNNLLLHNYFFPHLAYELLGFRLIDDTLYSCVKQQFVRTKEKTNHKNINVFLAYNGFVNTKNNDYFHPEFGVILEDLHDENVLTTSGALQFIDTAFYITDEFRRSEERRVGKECRL